MLKLIKSYLKRDKVGVITVGILALFAVFLMIIGMSISVKVDSLYEDKMEELDSYHIRVNYIDIVSESNRETFNDMFYTLIDKSEMERIDRIENQLWLKPENTFTLNKIKDNEVVQSIKYSGAGFLTEREFKKKNTVKEPEEGYYKLYVNTYWIKNLELSIGDKASLYISEEESINFELIGTAECVEIMYTAPIFYIEDEVYHLIIEEHKEIINNLEPGFGIILKDPSTKSVNRVNRAIIDTFKTVSKMFLGMDPEIENNDVGLYINTYNIAKDATEPYIKIMGIAFISFSILVVFIAIISLSFIISTSINADVKNVGVLRGLGYTVKDLRKSYIVLYLIVVSLSSLIGIILGVTLMPTFVNVITMMSNLIFTIPVFTPSILIAVVFVIGAILLSVFLVTRRIDGITPLYAIRKNISTHSFKKNRVPLDKIKVNHNISLGLKSVFNNIRQSAVIFSMIIVIMLLASFVSVAYFNLNVDTTAIVNLSGHERCDIVFEYGNKDTREEFIKRVESDERVEYILCEDRWSANLRSGDLCYLVSIDDYEKLKSQVVYKGRYPKEDNEIVVNYGYAKENGLEIGDMIEIKFSINLYNELGSRDFVIVGFSQALSGGGQASFLVKDSVTEYLMNEANLEDDYRDSFVYLKEGYRSKEEKKRFAEDMLKIREELTEINCLFWYDMEDEIYKSVLSVAGPASDAVLKIFFILGVLVIALLLLMITKIKIMKEGEDYAIFKSLGYTSLNIMMSISVSMLFVSLIASLIGGLLGGLLVNPLLDAVGSLFGVASMGFTVNWAYIAYIFIGINAIVFILSMLMSLRVKSISPIKMLRSN